MRKTIWAILAGLVVSVLVTFTTTSCNKNEFDKELADTMKLLTFHNDKVDPNHTWSLLNDYSVKILPNVPGVKRIEILSQNPYTSTTAELLASREVTENEELTIYYSVPTMCDSIYVAAVDENEKYTIVAAPYFTTKTINFNYKNTTNTGTFNKINPQKVYYCYDLNFPEAGTTWGYNDVIMALSKEYVNEHILRVTITLHGLGTTKQVAAGLRINGIKASKIAQVYTDNDESFVKNPNADRYIIKDKDIVLTARDGSPVINLFDDAHAAFFNQNNENGTITRYRFNVSHETGPEYMGYPEVTVTYNIIFKEKGLSSRLGFADLDLFVSYFYITAQWEIHKYRYKLTASLNDYLEGNENAYADKFTWALEIPYSQFRYPTYGNSMGSYKNGVSYGTYNRLKHSFGEWGADQNSATDWFLYPNSNMVY